MDGARFKAEIIPYSTDFYRIAYRMLGNEDDARDIVQELYVKLWNMRDKLDEVSSPKAFAKVMLRNSCIDKIRADKRWEQRIPADLAAEEIDDSPPDVDEEQFRRLEAAAEKLPEMQRKVFVYRYFKGLKIKEIADLAGLGQTNVRVMLLRARNNVKNKLREYEIN